jgi:hypothetical protein
MMRSIRDSITLATPFNGAQCQKSRRSNLYTMYRLMSLPKETQTHRPPTIASSAVLILLTKSSSAPFMIMQEKMAVLLPAESGM